jgi:membrane protein YdbS with pleckstrin-like domain
LIENYLQWLGVLVPLIAGLLAAFWKLLDKADDNRTKFQQDIMAVRGTVISGEIIPQLIKLLESIENERDVSGRTVSIDTIISRSTHGHTLRLVVDKINQLNDLDILLAKTLSFCFNAAYDVLANAIISGFFILWLFIDQYWANFLTIASLALAIIITKLIYDVLKYTRSVQKFIQKHSEMQLGRIQV